MASAPAPTAGQASRERCLPARGASFAYYEILQLFPPNTPSRTVWTPRALAHDFGTILAFTQANQCLRPPRTTKSVDRRQLRDSMEGKEDYPDGIIAGQRACRRLAARPAPATRRPSRRPAARAARATRP